MAQVNCLTLVALTLGYAMPRPDCYLLGYSDLSKPNQQHLDLTLSLFILIWSTFIIVMLFILVFPYLALVVPGSKLDLVFNRRSTNFRLRLQCSKYCDSCTILFCLQRIIAQVTKTSTSYGRYLHMGDVPYTVVLLIMRTQGRPLNFCY